MSTTKGGNPQEGDWLDFFKSVNAMVKGRREPSEEEKAETAQRRATEKKLFDLQRQGGA